MMVVKEVPGRCVNTPGRDTPNLYERFKMPHDCTTPIPHPEQPARTCTGCGQLKHVDAFYVRRGSAGSRCKECVKSARAEYRSKYPDKVKQCKNVSHMKYRDKDLAYYLQWRQSNPDKYLAGIKRWNAAHPEKVKAYADAAVARRKNAAVSDFTAVQWQRLKEAYGYRCAYCGRKMKRLTQDHVLATSRGGNHTLDNIVPACHSCNSHKRDKTPSEANMPLQQHLAVLFA